jgi:hypothetical protein
MNTVKKVIRYAIAVIVLVGTLLWLLLMNLQYNGLAS